MPDPSEASFLVEPFRPTQRPPMARLLLYDDGSIEGESFRIRMDKTTIGSKSADIVIPHDTMISDKHLSIERELRDKVFRWVIRDLESGTGFWVRVRRIELREGSEFLAGNGRYRFHEGKTLGSRQRAELIARFEQGSFPGDQTMQINGFPSVVRIGPSGEVLDGSLALIDTEHWIGRGKSSALAFLNDCFLAERHVCISKTDGKWMAFTEGAPNGIWVRMDQIVVSNSCTFQIGEKRCRFICAWARDET